MKTKLLILIFFTISLGVFFPNSVMAKADDGISVSTELPSDSYLRKEKRSIATTTDGTSASASSYVGITTANSVYWTDPFLPGEDGSGSNIVGGPIGDISLPIVLLLLVIYFVYKKVTVSRRRNNF